MHGIAIFFVVCEIVMCVFVTGDRTVTLVGQVPIMMFALYTFSSSARGKLQANSRVLYLHSIFIHVGAPCRFPAPHGSIFTFCFPIGYTRARATLATGLCWLKRSCGDVFSVSIALDRREANFWDCRRQEGRAHLFVENLIVFERLHS